MDARPAPPPTPVDGVVIGRSTAKLFLMIGAVILFFLLGLFLIWAKLSDLNILGKFLPMRFTWLALLFGIGLLVLAPYLLFIGIRTHLARRRIIIGGDRLQMIELMNGQDVVIVQIPYRNILNLQHSPKDSVIGINLRDLDDPETYASKEDFEFNFKHAGRHFTIGGGYLESLSTITDKLNRAREKSAT